MQERKLLGICTWESKLAVVFGWNECWGSKEKEEENLRGRFVFWWLVEVVVEWGELYWGVVESVVEWID